MTEQSAGNAGMTLGWKMRSKQALGLIVSPNDVGGFFGDHDCGRVGVACDDARHDRSVSNAEAFNAADAKARIHDGHRIAPHFASSCRMVESLHVVAKKVREI